MAGYGAATVHDRIGAGALANAVRAVRPIDAGGFSIGNGTARILAAIALAESGGRSDAVNHNVNGTDDLGYWQINTIWWQKYKPDAYKSGAWSQLDVQAIMAATVWHAQGLSAWTVYKTGKYREFLDDANAADVTPAGGHTDPVYANPLTNLLAHLVSGEFWKRVLLVAAGVGILVVGLKTYGK